MFLRIGLGCIIATSIYAAEHKKLDAIRAVLCIDEKKEAISSSQASRYKMAFLMNIWMKSGDEFCQIPLSKEEPWIPVKASNSENGSFADNGYPPLDAGFKSKRFPPYVPSSLIKDKKQLQLKMNGRILNLELNQSKCNHPRHGYDDKQSFADELKKLCDAYEKKKMQARL